MKGYIHLSLIEYLFTYPGFSISFTCVIPFSATTISNRYTVFLILVLIQQRHRKVNLPNQWHMVSNKTEEIWSQLIWLKSPCILWRVWETEDKAQILPKVGSLIIPHSLEKIRSQKFHPQIKSEPEVFLAYTQHIYSRNYKRKCLASEKIKEKLYP